MRSRSGPLTEIAETQAGFAFDDDAGDLILDDGKASARITFASNTRCNERKPSAAHVQRAIRCPPIKEGGPWAAESSKVVKESNEARRKLFQSCPYLSDACMAQTKSGTGMTRPRFDHQLTYASMIATISSDRGSTITI
jgi:hypothetical protein